MSEPQQLQNNSTQQKQSLVVKFASTYGVDSNKLLDTLKLTCFKQDGANEVSNEEMMALLVVADQYTLNPFTKEIYAFFDQRKGIVPVVGVDGWSRIINSHPEFDGMEFKESDEMVTMDGAKPCPEWMEVVMYRKDRSHPTIVREYLDEVYRSMKFVGPWKSHTKRMLRHKVMIQGGRIAFGFTGIYDEDEAQRIIEAPQDITNETEIIPPKRASESNQESNGEPPVINDDMPDKEEIEDGPINEFSIGLIKKMMEKQNVSLDDMRDKLGVESLEEIQKSELKNVFDWLEPQS